jgi:glycosyltransferase involved in cell wall biosynthesis
MIPPAVSIIIPTYNRVAFIGRALDSVRQQEMQDYEIIVVDDASTDETPALLHARAATDERIRIIRRTHGRHGPAAARNAGIAAARGAWIAFLDSDDEWQPGKLAAFLRATDNGVSLIGSDYHIIEDDQGGGQTMWNFIEQVMLPWWMNDPKISAVIPAARLRDDRSLLADPDVIRMMTIGGYLWPQTSSVMVRRSDAEAAGGFDEHLARTEDMDLWLKLLNRGRFVYIDAPLARYHIQGRDQGRGARYDTLAPDRRHDSYQEMLAHLRFLKTIPRRFPLSPAARVLLRDRVRAYHLYCAKAAGPDRPLAARWHRWRGGASA